MSETSPVEDYLDACDLDLDIQDDDYDHAFLQRLRLQQAIQQSCFNRLLEAADSQDPAVWHALGIAFDTCRGTTRDPAAAIRWFRRAAEAGHAPAMVSLGLRLQSRQPPRDLAAAIHWFRKAAEKGDPGGMVFLGFAYREGTACLAIMLKRFAGSSRPWRRATTMR